METVLWKPIGKLYMQFLQQKTKDWEALLMHK